MANIFPRWTNYLPLKIIFCLLVVGGAVSAVYWYYLTPEYLRAGYQPIQPVPFPHDIHVTQLGMDCRYCHSYVEVSSHSNVPTTQTCMNCHTQVQANNPKLAAVRESWQSGNPVDWVKVHQVPDYAYFNHSVHVNRGVSCVSCHGQVNEMNVVFQHEPQSMAWCLNCHRNPQEFVRPLAADKPGEPSPIFNLDWIPPAGTTQTQLGTKIVHNLKINPPTDCAGCHR